MMIMTLTWWQLFFIRKICDFKMIIVFGWHNNWYDMIWTNWTIKKKCRSRNSVCNFFGPRFFFSLPCFCSITITKTLLLLLLISIVDSFGKFIIIFFCQFWIEFWIFFFFHFIPLWKCLKKIDWYCDYNWKKSKEKKTMVIENSYQKGAWIELNLTNPWLVNNVKSIFGKFSNFFFWILGAEPIIIMHYGNFYFQ